MASVYSPPGIIKDFYLNLDKQIQSFKDLNLDATFVIAGDMNIDYMDNPNHKLNTILQEHGLKQVVTQGTMARSSKINDHVYTGIGTETQVTIEPTGISDHFTVQVKLNWQPKIKFDKTIETYSYSSSRIDNVKKHLNSYDWYSTLEHLTADEAAVKLTEIVSKQNEQHCKIQIKPHKARIAFPKTLRNLKSKVKSKYKDWNENRENHHKEQSYKLILQRYEKEYKKYIRYKLELSLAEKNPRKLWQNIKLATNTSSPRDNNDINLINSTNTSETFNEYFSSIATKIHGNLTIPEGDPTALTPTPNTSFNFKSPTPDMILNLFKNLQPKKSMGIDNISSKLLKELRFQLITPLKIILEKMIMQSSFPKTWKIAKVIPLFKKGDPKEPGNYRPISLLPAFSKLAEKLLASQMYEYLEKNNILPKTQFGFRRGKSTGQAVTNLVYELEHLNAKKKRYALIMIDFSKAFDLIDHKILQAKLRKLGFHANSIKLLISYLERRQQYVHCNSKNSDLKTLAAVGCPQGSVLGPLLYLIYTIDITNLIGEHFHIMFADDTGLIIEIDDQHSLRDVEILMGRILKHFTMNKLKMNIEKTVILGKGIEGEILVEGKKMEIQSQSKGERYLGVKINPQLNWNEHFNDLTKKLKLGLYALAKIKRIKNVHVKKSVYEAFIKSHLTYAMHAWYPGLTKSQKDILEKLNKAAVRMIVGARKQAHSAEIYKTLNILRVEDLFTTTVVAGARRLKERINNNNNLNKYMVITEPKTRSAINYNPRQKGNVIRTHARILNSQKDYLQKKLSREATMEGMKKDILQAYHTECGGTGCRSCEQTTKVLSALMETEARLNYQT